ncbi:MAG: HPr family phosphocarrier protein [Planctomycetaceae bacterium]|jgi:phosphotransferase system HPr (HPr) family protein|nr:HPr family phosphocarrier protein [Planctomycetaceae bacterium]
MSTDGTTLVCDLEVTNCAGIHTRVALLIFKKLESYKNCSASLTRKSSGYTADCRSVLNLLSLGAAQGEVLTLSVLGENAESLQKELTTLFENKFYEDDKEIKEENGM